MKTVTQRIGWFGLLLLWLCGCSASPTALSETHIVVLWHSFTGPEAAALQTLSDDFNAGNDAGIVLLVEYQQNILPKLQASTSEQRPDLIVIWPEDLQPYRQAGLITGNHVWPVAVRQEAADMLPMAQSLYTIGEDVLALPLGLATYLAYYNADWMSDLGYHSRTATWEEVRVALCAATDPVVGRVGLGLPPHPGAFLAFLTSGGSAIVGEEGLYHFSDYAGLRTTEVLKDIFEADCGRIYASLEEGAAWFSHSSVALMVESSLRLFTIEQAVAKGRNFTLEVESLPGPAGPGRTLWYGPGLTLIAPEGARQQAAQTVLTWFFTPAAQTTWSTATHYLPVRRSLIEARAAAATSPAELRLLEITQAAAVNNTWVAWPRYTNTITCRAALLRGLLSLKGETPARSLVEMVSLTCNQSILESGEGQP